MALGPPRGGARAPGSPAAMSLSLKKAELLLLIVNFAFQMPTQDVRKCNRVSSMLFFLQLRPIRERRCRRRRILGLRARLLVK